LKLDLQRILECGLKGGHDRFSRLAIKGEQHNNTRMVGPTIQAVWKMFYREFGVRVYHNLPRSRFDEAMVFLRGVAKQFGVELDKGEQ